MHIIINGIQDGNLFEQYEHKFEKNLAETDVYFKLRDMNIYYCQGCWDCWVKTPGICRIQDDYVQILSKIPHAEVVTVLTPIVAGFETSLVKKFKDRIIPMAHPYIVTYKGEQHHRKRYEQTPKFKVIVLEDEKTTAKELDLLKRAYERMVLNFHSELLDFSVVPKGAV